MADLSRHIPPSSWPCRPRACARIRTVGALTALLALSLGACGGGGGGGDDGGPGLPPGIQGQVLLADVDLGRLIEQEPNGGSGQAFHLPPLPPRTRLEVTGEVGATAARFGRADLIDAFRVESLAAQDLSLVLDYGAADPQGGPGNDLGLSVFDGASGSLLAASATGPAPRGVSVPVTAGSSVEVHVSCQAGHAAYVLSIVGSDPIGAPAKPVALSVVGTEGVPASASTPEIDCASSHLLVRLRDGVDPETVARRLGLHVGRRTASGSWRLELPAPVGASRTASKRVHAVQTECARAQADGDVVWAEPDWLVQTLADPTDPEFARQWNLKAIGVEGAWDVTRGSPDIVVGVIDSGVVPHPDLEGQVVEGYDFISSASISGDGDGRDPDPTDTGDRKAGSGLSSWHGTHVAAIIAGRTDDGRGICGVAPGCRVMPLRAIGVGGGYVSDVADAVMFAAGLHTTEEGRTLEAPLPIVNLSLGLDTDSAELSAACAAAANVGVLLIGATGNTGKGVLYPARYSSVLAVAAVDGRLSTTGYSNFGPEVDVSAPGGLGSRDQGADGWPDGILSAVIDQTQFPPVFSYGDLEGTSQAVPHVAGVAALLLSVDPTIPRTTLEVLLTRSAIDKGNVGKDEAYGWGVLNAPGAMRLLHTYLSQPHPEPPHVGLTRSSVQFFGFDLRQDVDVMNLGGGVLLLGPPTWATDDGKSWLRAENVFASGDEEKVLRIAVHVDRNAVPTTPGRYSGTVFVRDLANVVVGSIRVVLYVTERLRAGLNATVVARQVDNGAVRAIGRATAAFGYRYWFPEVPAGSYKIMAGTDIDGDGFFCEGGDACGWYGGADETTAGVVELVATQTVLGADVYLMGP